MEQDFLGLSSDFKRIRPDTLQVLKLSENVMTSIKLAIDDIRQQQQKKLTQNQKKEKAKNKRNQRSTSPSSKKAKRRCSVLLRGGKTVKKVVLEKVSSHKAPTFGMLEGGNEPQKNLEIEFISTPFNEEIGPIKMSKLDKLTAKTITNDQPTPPPMKQNLMFNDMQRFLPTSYPALQKNIMPFSQEAPPVIYRESVNVNQKPPLIWMGMSNNDKMNMGLKGMNPMNTMNMAAAMNGMGNLSNMANMNMYSNPMMMNPNFPGMMP